MNGTECKTDANKIVDDCDKADNILMKILIKEDEIELCHKLQDNNEEFLENDYIDEDDYTEEKIKIFENINKRKKVIHMYKTQLYKMGFLFLYEQYKNKMEELDDYNLCGPN